MTSLLDRPITAASDDGACRCHAAKLWQTRAKLLKLNSICITSCTTTKNVLKFGLLILKSDLKNLSSAGKRTALRGSYRLELAFLMRVAFIALRALRWLETPLKTACL